METLDDKKSNGKAERFGLEEIIEKYPPQLVFFKSRTNQDQWSALVSKNEHGEILYVVPGSTTKPRTRLS